MEPDMIIVFYIIGVLGTALAAYDIYKEDTSIPQGQSFPDEAPLWFIVTFVSLLWPILYMAALSNKLLRSLV